MIHIVIPPVNKQKNDPLSLGGAYFGSFSLSSTFRYLQVSVKSKDPKLPTAYTITFSSG